MYLLTFCIVSANLVSQICFDSIKCTLSAEPKPKLTVKSGYNFHKDVKTTLLKNVTRQAAYRVVCHLGFHHFVTARNIFMLDFIFYALCFRWTVAVIKRGLIYKKYFSM